MTTIRRLSDDEIGIIRPLFAEVFGHPVSLDLLKWKYANHRGESWVVSSASGSPTMHCGIFFRDILIGGRTRRVAQLVDLMAQAKSLGLARSDSPFAKLMRQILQRLPDQENPDGITFGFPSDRAMRLAVHLGVSRAVDHLMELEFAPSTSQGRQHWRLLSSIDHSDTRRLNVLWKQMAEDLSGFVLGVRDVDYLQRRYLSHPEKHYTLLLVESHWLKRPLGLAVVGPGTDCRELLDVVCARKNIPWVIAATQHWMARSSIKALVFSITKRFAEPLAGLAVRTTLTQFRISANPYSSPASIAALENRWWLTGGDTDYR